MAISFLPTGDFDKMAEFLATKCNYFFKAVVKATSETSGQPNLLWLFPEIDSMVLTDHQPDDWSTNYANYFTLDSETGIYNEVQVDDEHDWVANKYYRQAKTPFLVLSFTADSPAVLKWFSVNNKDGASLNILNTSGTNYKLRYVAKCANGLMLSVGSNAITTYPTGKATTILITDNNSGVATVVIAAFTNNSSSDINRNAAFTTGVRCLSYEDEFDMSSTFSYTRQYMDQWQMVSFITPGDGLNPSYTPHAYYMQCVEYGFDTMFGRISDKEGYGYMTNGFWAVKDTKQVIDDSDDE